MFCANINIPVETTSGKKMKWGTQTIPIRVWPTSLHMSESWSLSHITLLLLQNICKQLVLTCVNFKYSVEHVLCRSQVGHMMWRMAVILLLVWIIAANLPWDYMDSIPNCCVMDCVLKTENSDLLVSLTVILLLYESPACEIIHLKTSGSLYL